MISQTAEHALRAVLFLAQQPQGVSVAATRIAEAIDAPANYLGKTLQVLSKHGFVSGVRGPAGGFRLARAADAITLAEICDVFAEAPRSRVCLLGDRPCSDERPCSAHERWKAIHASAAQQLATTTVADLIGTPGPRSNEVRLEKPISYQPRYTRRAS